jgi:hypothetical protein
MKILFVCHRLPFPPNRGGKIRPFHMIQHLSQKHSVVVASLAHSEDEVAEGKPLEKYCEKVLVDVLPNRTRWTQAVCALPTSMPSSVAYFNSKRLTRMIQEESSRQPFDAIVVHCAFVAHYVLDLPCKIRLLDFGDVDSAKWATYARWRPWPLSMGYKIEADKLRRYERNCATKFDICTATTQGELEEVQKMELSKPNAVIPNGVDLEYFDSRTESPKGSASIVFLGRMDYFPNIEGAEYFAREIFPLIRQSVPRAEFQIVGSNPSKAVRKLAAIPGITVTGHVPDVRPYLKNAALAVAPLRIARGTQNKILQFLATGVPVVTTTEAAKGVAAKAGRDFLVADNPKDFAAQVLRLLNDPQLRESLATAGREPLKTAHDWSRSMTILDSLLEGSFTQSEPAPRTLAPQPI